jgi:acetate kinase
MQNVLVINCGSSSLKYQLLEMVKSACWPRAWSSASAWKSASTPTSAPGPTSGQELPVPDHARAIELVLAALPAASTA